MINPLGASIPSLLARLQGDLTSLFTAAPSTGPVSSGPATPGPNPVAVNPGPAAAAPSSGSSAAAFPNGETIYQGDSYTPIDPNSAQGQTIMAIYAQQDADRQANAAQKAYFDALQQTQIPQSYVSPYHLNSSGTPVFSEQFDNPDYPRTPAEIAADKQAILDNTIEFVGAPSDPPGFKPGDINPYNPTSPVAGQQAVNKPVVLGPGISLQALLAQLHAAVQPAAS
ncbi:MAG: hypothetical protein KGR26_13845 [Cyanobacteria bacterium REEB65]|nr:hypothetical protein [Cyanobacteria bacterium REEB65]